jgi:hypothetical protein
VKQCPAAVVPTKAGTHNHQSFGGPAWFETLAATLKTRFGKLLTMRPIESLELSSFDANESGAPVSPHG